MHDISTAESTGQRTTLAACERLFLVQAGGNYLQGKALQSASLPSQGTTELLTYKNTPVFHCVGSHRCVRNPEKNTVRLLQRPLVHTSVASHAFTIAAPTLWNSLSVNTRSANSFASFKRTLKSELYVSA